MIKISTSKHINDSSREYAIYVCENRSIPKIADGLKDGQRKALWLMKNHNGEIKTIALAGELISSNLYLHGDASAAESISMLAAPYVNNIPMLEGIGTFGTRLAPTEGISAPRYTYVKRNKASEEILLRDIDLVPLRDNYDGSTKEPINFLPIIPTILLNGVSGIAVGWSTEILPRSLDSLIQATLDTIDGKKIKRIKPCFEYLNVGVKHLEDNSWEFSGKVKIADHSTCYVTELPPRVSLERFKLRLDELEQEGTIKGWIDRSTDFINIEVNFKRGTLNNYNEDQLIELFKLKEKRTERIVVIDWDGDSIKQYERAEDVVKEFVDWRFKFYVARFKKLLADDSYQLKYWLALKECFDQDLPAKLPHAKDKGTVIGHIEKITKSIKPDDEQIDRISSRPSYSWAKDYYQETKDKIKELEDKIKSHNKHLKDHSLIKQVFRDEVLSLRKLKRA